MEENGLQIRKVAANVLHRR